MLNLYIIIFRMPKNQIIPYRKDLQAKARYLGKHSTLSEVLLWCEIKNRQIVGYQFHRQVPMLEYIVDFYCHELKLAIEIDGDNHEHEETQIYDKIRQAKIEKYGVKFLRFDDQDVKTNIAWVLGEINYEINFRVKTLP